MSSVAQLLIGDMIFLAIIMPSLSMHVLWQM